LHQVGDLFKLNLKLRCQKVNEMSGVHRDVMSQQNSQGTIIYVTEMMFFAND